MAKRTRVFSDRQTLSVLTATVVAAAVLGALYLGRTLLIPFALAVYLTFLLSPLVRAFQRCHLGRVPSVLLVSTLAAALVGSIGWVVVRECASFLNELPNYSDALDKKVNAVKGMFRSHSLDRLQKAVRDLDDKGSAASKEPTASPGPQTTAEKPGGPVPVVVEPQAPTWLQWIPTFVPPAMEFLAQTGLVVVLAIFMLFSREQLRNRFISLIGHGHLTVTTKAVDDASQRISRYLLMQLMTNAGFAVIMALGLQLIGVQYAPLWGFLVGLMRYVPYIGSPVAILFPLGVSILLSNSWLAPLLVLGLFVVLELITANAVEPLLFGHTMGVSAVALLAAAAFWSLIWGPVGLVLACPLTVCLVVLGKYVPRLGFLTTLLGDEPALSDDTTFYQRLAAHDQDEASQIAVTQLERHSLQDVFDELVIPALSYSRRDRFRGGISDREMFTIQGATREIVETLIKRNAERTCSDSKLPAPAGAAAGKAVRIVIIPAHDDCEETMVRMLQALLDPAKWELHCTAVDQLAAEIEQRVDEEQPALACIVALQPGSLSHTRYLAKKLRARFPGLPIVVEFWLASSKDNSYVQRLQDAGANHIKTSLVSMLRYLEAWRPPLLQRQADGDGTAAQRHDDCVSA